MSQEEMCPRRKCVPGIMSQEEMCPNTFPLGHISWDIFPGMEQISMARKQRRRIGEVLP